MAQGNSSKLLRAAVGLVRRVRYLVLDLESSGVRVAEDASCLIAKHDDLLEECKLSNTPVLVRLRRRPLLRVLPQLNFRSDSTHRAAVAASFD